jgi:O-methyltransferase
VDAVRGRILAAGLSDSQLLTIEGPAQHTLQSIQPESVAILRLDADLFDPTLAALEQLYDRVVPGGYIIVDDYGHWKGCAEAVDTFFARRGETISWTEIDYTCIGWKK